jgi:hypothetical protein
MVAEKDKRNILSLIKLLGAKPGVEVQIGLFKGAEYYNGHTEAPTINPRGYSASGKMTKEAGHGFLGYVTKFDKGKISVSFGRDPEEKKSLESELYFWGDVIRDFVVRHEVRAKYLANFWFDMPHKYHNFIVAFNDKETNSMLVGDYDMYEPGMFLQLKNAIRLNHKNSDKGELVRYKLSNIGDCYAISPVDSPTKLELKDLMETA